MVVMVPGSDQKPGDGVTRHVYEVSKRLAKRGIKVLGIKPSSEALRVKYIENYMLLEVPNKYFSLLHSGIASKIPEFLNNVIYYSSYRDVVRNFIKYSKSSIILHTHGFYTLSQPSNNSDIIKRLSTYHGFVPLDIAIQNNWYFGAKMLLSLLKRVYRNADHYTTFTEQTKIIANRLYGIELERIDVVPHGVDADFFQREAEFAEIKSVEKEYNLNKPYRILFLGHLSKGKRPDLMLKAFKIVSSRRKDLMLVIVSRWGDYYLDTIKLVRDLNLGSTVRIISEPLCDDKLRAIYKTATAFINIYQLYSGYSTALLEAMASGIPPIVYEHSGNRYVVDESVGFILRKLDPNELADLLAYIVENEEETKKKGKNAQFKVSKFYDWDRAVIPKYISVYNKLLAYD